MSNELMRVAIDGDTSLIVEVDAEDPGFQPATRRRDRVAEAANVFEAGFDEIVQASRKTLELFRSGALDPDEVEIVVGVKINAQMGAVLAKVGGEGHMSVRLMWAKPKS